MRITTRSSISVKAREREPVVLARTVQFCFLRWQIIHRYSLFFWNRYFQLMALIYTGKRPDVQYKITLFLCPRRWPFSAKISGSGLLHRGGPGINAAIEG